jgi:hypothetical protein
MVRRARQSANCSVNPCYFKRLTVVTVTHEASANRTAEQGEKSAGQVEVMAKAGVALVKSETEVWSRNRFAMTKKTGCFAGGEASDRMRTWFGKQSSRKSKPNSIKKQESNGTEV